MTTTRYLKAIEGFVRCVCERAEDYILKTGKLEGAHYAAMTAILEEMRAQEAAQPERAEVTL